LAGSVQSVNATGFFQSKRKRARSHPKESVLNGAAIPAPHVLGEIVNVSALAVANGTGQLLFKHLKK
uniref:Senescence domain-containing protein n=1 Tax=Gongylonema pulchrum TaxID=637853 RepID=A0A183D3Y0_9BILA